MVSMLQGTAGRPSRDDGHACTAGREESRQCVWKGLKGGKDGIGSGGGWKTVASAPETFCFQRRELCVSAWFAQAGGGAIRSRAFLPVFDCCSAPHHSNRSCRRELGSSKCRRERPRELIWLVLGLSSCPRASYGDRCRVREGKQEDWMAARAERWATAATAPFLHGRAAAAAGLGWAWAWAITTNTHHHHLITVLTSGSEQGQTLVETLARETCRQNMLLRLLYSVARTALFSRIVLVWWWWWVDSGQLGNSPMGGCAGPGPATACLAALGCLGGDGTCLRYKIMAAQGCDAEAWEMETERMRRPSMMHPPRHEGWRAMAAEADGASGGDWRR